MKNTMTNTGTITKEEMLIEALPYIQRYEGKTFVIKYGGAAMTDEYLKESFAKDIILLAKIGINIIIVHGGGNAISGLSQKLGHEVQFYNGQRYTDENTLSAVVMSLVGTTNKEIVRLVNQHGGAALGMSGMDGCLLQASKFCPDGIDLGSVGKVASVNTELIRLLLSNGLIPVIAPVATDENGDMYNINADITAGAIAGALGAEKLFYMSDTEGILNNGNLIPTLTTDKTQQLIKNGIISGGMIPKVHSAIDALEAGVHKVHIINGTTKHSLLLEIFTNVGVGTQIIRSEKKILFPSKTGGKKLDLLDFTNLDSSTLNALFETADYLRIHPDVKPLSGKTVTMIFQKPSLRTRVSFEVGIAQLGGTSVVLANESIGLGERERVDDIAKVITGYSDAIVARVFEHELLVGLAEHSDIPVINALSDLLHPCQILADAYTIYRHGKLSAGMKIVFIGDGNNVANSWLELAAIIPLHLVLAVPKGYEPNSIIMQKVIDIGISTIEINHDPQSAVKDADVLYTDVWTSMGREEEMAVRQLVFKDYCITNELLQKASPDCMIMHCLPAHRGEEITEEMIVSPQSVIFEEAENRLHIQKALLYYLLAGDGGKDGNTATTNITENAHEKNSKTISYKRDHFTSEHLQPTGARKRA